MKKIILSIICLTFLATPLATKADDSLFQGAKQSYLNALTVYKSARQEWLLAKDVFQKSKKTKGDLDTVLPKVKNYLLKIDEVIIDYLTTLRTRIDKAENINDATQQKIISEINTYINFFEGQKVNINNATTKADVVAVVKSVNDKWQNVRKDIKNYIGQILVAKVQTALDKLETARDSVKTKIQTLKASGTDTTNLDNLLGDLNTKINTAQDQLDKAKAKYDAINTVADADTLFREGNDFIRNAYQYSKDAVTALKAIITELRQTSVKSEVVSGTGTIRIQGTGTATLTGNGTMSGTTATGAILTVTDNGGDAAVDTNAIGTKEDLGNNQTRYSGFGKIAVTGSNVQINLKGSALNLSASGTGTVTMTGTGTYQIGNNAQTNIPTSGITINITP